MVPTVASVVVVVVVVLSVTNVQLVEALSPSSPTSSSSSWSQPPTPAKPSSINVLVVGGCGRVGGSTVSWLEIFSRRGQERARAAAAATTTTTTTVDDDDPLHLLATHDMKITVGSRKRQSYDRALNQQKLFSSNVEYLQLDLEEDTDEELIKKLQPFDAVVHTAGPFQGRTDPKLLRVCLQSHKAYVDVCDEYELALTSKEELFDLAVRHRIPAVVCGGIWPGMSALMAMDAVEKQFLTFQQQHVTDDDDAVATVTDIDVEYSFFTAGTGNAGPTIVSATFLLLATPVLTFINSQAKKQEPWTSPREINFGPKVGIKPVWLLDNPDVPTTASALLSSKIFESSLTQSKEPQQPPFQNVKNINVSSRFGTDPLVWNYLFGGLKTFIPRPMLYNQELMQNFALFSEPIIRLVDKLVGATNAMRVDVTMAATSTAATSEADDEQQHQRQVKKTTKHTSLIVHPDLERCVGLATAAFAIEVIGASLAMKNDRLGLPSSTEHTIPPGVWYPSELPKQSRKNLLRAAKEETITYEL